MIQDSDTIASQKVVDHIHFRDELRKEFDMQLEREIIMHNKHIPGVWDFNYMVTVKGCSVVEFRQLKISTAMRNQFEYVLESLLKELDTFDIYFSFKELDQKFGSTIETVLI